MGEPNTEHRPLVSGIRIASGKRVDGQLEPIEAGTLTGLTIRNSDGKKFLVTNLHVMTGGIPIPASGDEEMYQESVSADKKVGSRIAWVPIEEHEGDPLIPPDEANLADVAMCELEDGVAADFTMHDASHSGRLIIEGVVEPTEGMTLTMLGQAGRVREGTVTVREVGWRLNKDERWFTGLAVLDTSQRPVEGGDSGAACLYQVSDNRYKMSCIEFVGIVRPGTTAYAFPASVAQQKLGITFGEKVVLKDLVLNKQAGFDEDQYGTWQALTDFSNNALSLDTIDASGSGSHRRWSGPAVPNTSGEGSHPWWSASIAAGDYNPSSIDLQVLGGPDISSELVSGRKWGFKMHVKRTTETIWKHVLGGSGTLFTLSFTSGTDRKTVVGARLTIPLTVGRMDWPAYFHPDNEDAFEVKIEGAPANRAPVADAGTAQTVDAGTTVTLSGSGTDPDGDTLTYKWEQSVGVGGTGIEITDADEKIATFTAPTGPAALTFLLTVTDNHGASAEDTVSVTVRAAAPTPPPSETWPPWTDTGSTRGCGPTKEKEQSRTSNLGNRRTRWVDAPEPETWGSWSDTGSTRGCGPSNEKGQERTSSCGNRQTRWVDAPEPETWGSWSDTGRTVGSLGNRRSEQKRTSNCGSTQTEWIQDPEPETWGQWSDTGASKIVGIEQWKEQARTSNYGNRQTRWVIDL